MPNQHKRAPLSIRLPEAEEARLRAYAEQHHISIGEAVRLAVRELTGDEVPEPPGTGRTRPTGEAVTMDDEQRPDLAKALRRG
jgi:hypothetical protein